MALFNRRMPRGVIVHTDRGNQYWSHEHRDLLTGHGLIASMSAKGNCYDNAAMESWNHSLKVEAVHGERARLRVNRGRLEPKLASLDTGLPQPGTVRAGQCYLGNL